MDDEAVEVPAAVDDAAHDEEADEGPDDRFVVQGAMEGPFRDGPVVAPAVVGAWNMACVWSYTKPRLIRCAPTITSVRSSTAAVSTEKN